MCLLSPELCRKDPGIEERRETRNDRALALGIPVPSHFRVSGGERIHELSLWLPGQAARFFGQAQCFLAIPYARVGMGRQNPGKAVVRVRFVRISGT